MLAGHHRQPSAGENLVVRLRHTGNEVPGGTHPFSRHVQRHPAAPERLHVDEFGTGLHGRLHDLRLRQGQEILEARGGDAGSADLDRHRLPRIIGQIEGPGTVRVTSEHDDMAQIGKFEAAVGEARDAGLSPRIRHLTASDGSLSYPDAHYEMVRVVAALYGLDPFSAGRAGEWGLRPVMTAKTSVVQVKRVEAGQGVSYGYLHKTDRATTLALVPVGYAEGLPRDATRHVQVLLNNRLYPILARIAMDQFVLDVGDDLVEVGDQVVLFGDPRTGATSVDDFASACSTINYEIVTRMGGRFKRVYVGGE